MSALIVKIPSKNVFIDSNLNTSNFAGSTALFNGLFLGTTIYRDLMQFDLSGLPSGYVITKAELALYIFRNDYPAISKAINIYRLTQSFQENTVTYSNQPTVAANLYSTLTINNELNTYIKFDVTGLVAEWYQGKYQNNGILMRASNESINSLVAFYSKEYSNDIYYPQLEISLELEVRLNSNKFISYSETSLATGDSYSFTTAYDISEVKVYTFFVKNTGFTNNCKAFIQISPNLTDWISDSAEHEISPGNIIGIVPRTFSRYVRLAYKSAVSASSTNIDYYIQTQD